MKNLQLDYENNYEVRDYIQNDIVPSIQAELVNAYGYHTEDYDADCTDEYIHEIIDSLSDVIYTYQAKKISEAFNLCPFNDVNDMTGEKFNSYSEMAYAVIYNEFCDSPNTLN